MNEEKAAVKSFGAKRAKPDAVVLTPDEQTRVGGAGGVSGTGTIHWNFIQQAGVTPQGGDFDG